MFRKIFSFSLIIMVVSVFVAWQSVSASSATDSSQIARPTKTPTRTKTSTPTRVPSATPTLPAASLNVTSPNGGEVFQNGEVYAITWQSSSDIQYVDIVVGAWLPCEGCQAYWSTEWSTGPIANSGSYDWTVALDESAGRQYFVMVIGQAYQGGSYTPLALDVSNRPFTVLPSATPTATATDEPSATPTATATSTGTSTITFTPTTTFTRTPTVTWTPDNPD